MKKKLIRKRHPEIYLLSVGLLSSCGYVKVFDGKNDELIAWNPEKGFEEDPTGGAGKSGGGTTSEQASASACAEALTDSEISFGAGDSSASVTTDFTVPQSISACSVSWSLSSSDSNYVSFSGANASVTRPRSLSDKTVSLVATVRSGDATVTKTISVNIKAGVVDAASFNAANTCQSGFSTSNITLSGADTATAVTQDFTLPTSVVIDGQTCSISSWTSNDSAISLTGNSATISRPADNSSDDTVTLTSTVSVNGETAAQLITITLKVKKYTEAETLTSCKDSLTTDDFTNIDKNSETAATILATTPTITFPTNLSGGASSTCTITWASNNTTYLSVSGGTGTVTPDFDAASTIVTLTPTITRGGETDSSKTFSMTVRSKFTSTKTISAFDNGGGSLGVSYIAAKTTDTATIKYKVCYSLDSNHLATITSMNSAAAGLTCQVENVAYPNIASPLSFSVGATIGETWYARVYAFIDGQPDQDDKKILYNLGAAEYNLGAAEF